MSSGPEPPTSKAERAGAGVDDGDLTIIRVERTDDREAIARVVEAAFGSPAHAKLVDDIRASPEFIPDLSLVAEVDGRIAGHVMISGATLHEGDARRPIVMLSPLAVAPDLQRRGIGGSLVREVTARADERGEPLVILEGDPRYYGRFGFEHAAPLGLHIALPSWAPSEAGQVLRLRRYDPSLQGQVVYPAAFDPFEDQ